MAQTSPKPKQIARLKKLQSNAMQGASTKERRRVQTILEQTIMVQLKITSTKLQKANKKLQLPSQAAVSSSVDIYLDDHPEIWTISGEKNHKKAKLTSQMAQSMARQIIRLHLFPEPKQLKQNCNGDKAEFAKSNTTNDFTSCTTKKVSVVMPTKEQPTAKEILEAASPWKVLDAYQTVMAEDQEISDHKAAVAKKSKVASDLEDQMKERRRLEEEERKQKQLCHEEQTRRLDEWRAQTKVIDKKEKEQMEQLRILRLAQIKESKERKEQEKESKKLEAERLIKECKEAQIREEKKQILKQQEEIERHRRTKEENILQEKIRKKRKEEEDLEELKCREEAKKRQDEEDQRRQQAFQERVARYERYAQQMEASTHVQEQREENLRLEKKILREAQEKEAREELREKQDKKALLERRRAMADANRHMVEEKSQKEEMEKKLDKEYLEKKRAEGKELIAEQKRKKAEENKRKKLYFSQLKEQEGTDKVGKDATSLDGMTSLEQSLNQDALKKIFSDDTLQKRIAEKLH